MKDNSQNINQDVLEQAIKEGIKYPKVTVYYREITTPRFKLSLWIPDKVACRVIRVVN